MQNLPYQQLIFPSIKIIFFSFLISTPAKAQIIDELKDGELKDSEIINRPMRNDMNLQAIQPAFDKSDPKDNVLRFTYNENMTYKIRLREYMNTSIILPKWEKIAGFALGDQNNFSFTPMGEETQEMNNICQIRAKYPGADTNLTIFGKSGNIYSFYLRVDSVQSPFVPTLITYIDDPDIKKSQIVNSGKTKITAKKEIQKKDYLKNLPLVDPSKLNYNYKIKDGDKSLSPLRIFDDEYFTYFQLSDDETLNKSTVPAIYRVVDGFDVIVNTRVVDGTIIAELVNDKWTLRSGDKHLCIRAGKTELKEVKNDNP